jgi:hypothetical protein
VNRNVHPIAKPVSEVFRFPYIQPTEVLDAPSGVSVSSVGLPFGGAPLASLPLGIVL